MTVPKNHPQNKHAVATDEQAIAACRSLLDTLNVAIQHRRWSQVARIAVDYSERVRSLDVFEDENSRAELIQLDIWHRRCMRILSLQMKIVAEDISSLEIGQKTLQYSRQAAVSLFQSS